MICIKTTMNLDDELVRQLKRRAVERGTTVTALVEDALRASLARQPSPPAYVFAMPTVRGDRPPRVDPADRDALHDAMEGQAPGAGS